MAMAPRIPSLSIDLERTWPPSRYRPAPPLLTSQPLLKSISNGWQRQLDTKSNPLPHFVVQRRRGREGRRVAAMGGHLYALDFDGVLCDSCGESSLSAVKAAKVRWPWVFEQVDEAMEEWIVEQMHTVLIQWSDSPEDMATWEDLESLRQQFPRAPAWGQAGFQDPGNVNAPTSTTSSVGGDVISDIEPRRSRRERKKPVWLAGQEWAK